MKKTMETRIFCKVCGSDSISGFGKVTNGNYPADFLEKYTILNCEECLFKFIYPTPTDEAINFIYSGTEYSQWEIVDKTNKTISTRYLNFKYYAEIISTYKKSGKVLDCGCATGLFLDIMKDGGFDCFGVEISNTPYSIVEKKHPNKIFRQEIENLKIDDGFFDIITMFDFIEHVKDPRQVIDKANKLLSDGGLLFIITPDTSSLSASIMGKSHNDYIMEHLGLFNKKNITYFLDKYGFEILKIQPAKKIINLDFVEKVFKRHTNIIYYPINFLNRLLPKKVAQIPIKLSFGGMFIVAKKRNS